MANPNDPRSAVGRYSRGNNVYNGAGSSPNPSGTNQYPKNLQAAAALRRKKKRVMNILPPNYYANSLVSEYGGNFQ